MKVFKTLGLVVFMITQIQASPTRQNPTPSKECDKRCECMKSAYIMCDGRQKCMDDFKEHHC